MEQAAQPEVLKVPVEAAILKALRAQLARPVAHYPYAPSAFSRRN